MNMDMNETTERIVDLLIEQALHGLDDEDGLRLDALLAGVDDDERERLEKLLEAALAAAANASALADETPAGTAPPAHLLARLEADADRFFGGAGAAIGDHSDGVASLQPRRATAHAASATERARMDVGARRQQPARRGAPWAAWSGWAVAAMLLITLWVGRPASAPGPVPAAPGVGEARDALIAAADTLQLDWAPSAWADFEGVRGDVSWNDARQEGYLRLVGMPSNDPARSQYQLWIVDPERDEEPVDGGVFDIPAGATEVVVPIQAKLAVTRPVAFAITRERPGGVVVSEGPLLVVASRG